MGGSTGSVSSVIGAPPNSLIEKERRTQQDLIGMPDLHDGIRQVTGTVREVHESKPLIKATSDEGSTIANGTWIPLNHSVADIAERWGKLRKGLRVLVSYSGPDGRSANATITGEEGDVEGKGTQVENDIEESLYEIFSPGSFPA